MLPALRLAWQLQRFELVVLIGGCLLLAVVAAVLAWQLGIARDDLVACYGTAPDSAAPGWPCRSIDAWANQLTNGVMIATGIGTAAPFLIGVFLGVPIVAREVERGTAPIAWSLARSRSGWLAMRVLPVAVGATAALLALGAASEAALLAVPPEQLGLRNFGMHGPLLAVRGLAALGIGILVGASIGRTLPAILVSGLLIGIVLAGLHFVRYELMAAEAVWIDAQQEGYAIDYVFDSGFRDDATGEIIGFEEAYERHPEYFEGPQTDPAPQGMTMVMKANPPGQYGIHVLREGAMLIGLTAVLTAASLLLVRARRPT